MSVQPGSKSRPALVIGLTGGIGSGKSAAARLFAERGVPVVDADVVARDLVAPGEPALEEIHRAFGATVLTDDGELDRQRLRELVFASEARRRELEAILHPRVYTEMARRLAALDGPYAVAVVPLLLETGGREMVDRVLVVDAPEEVQIERTAARDGSSREAVARILAAQMSREARLAAADDVLENDGDLDALAARVDALHRRYLALAASVASGSG